MVLALSVFCKPRPQGQILEFRMPEQENLESVLFKGIIFQEINGLHTLNG